MSIGKGCYRKSFSHKHHLAALRDIVYADV